MNAKLQKAGSEESAGQKSSLEVSVETELSELFLRFSADYELATCPMVTMRYCATSSRRVCSENAIKGFAGKWTFFRADSANDSSISSQFRCLRTYDLVSQENEGDTACTIKFQTFNESEPSNGRARKRSIDGIYESSHFRSSADLFFSNNTSLSEAEKDEDVPECVFWRSVALDNENVMRIAPTLPPRPHAAELEKNYPTWTANNGTAGVFAFEAFLMSGEDRWSMGALYSLQDLSLISHFCIQEKLTAIDPAKPMHFDKFKYRQAAGKLSEDPASWLDTADYRGEMTEMIWDEDGEAMKLPPRPANFNPPNTDSTTHRLFLYEDGCYAYYPLKLPEVHADGTKQFGEGARFEMGLLQTNGRKTFRRLILRYSAAGAAVCLTKELFKADGSFEFDRRQSQSVRRSIGSRRAASTRFDSGSLLAKTGDYRAAKLRDAFHRAESEQESEEVPQTSMSPPPRAPSGNILDKATLSRLMDKTNTKN